MPQQVYFLSQRVHFLTQQVFFVTKSIFCHKKNILSVKTSLFSVTTSPFSVTKKGLFSVTTSLFSVTTSLFSVPAIVYFLSPRVNFLSVWSLVMNRSWSCQLPWRHVRPSRRRSSFPFLLLLLLLFLLPGCHSSLPTLRCSSVGLFLLQIHRYSGRFCRLPLHDLWSVGKLTRFSSLQTRTIKGPLLAPC